MAAVAAVVAVAAVAVACVVGACVRVCVCACVFVLGEPGKQRAIAPRISAIARPQHAHTQLVRASLRAPRRNASVAALCGASRHALLRGRGGSGPNTQLWARIFADFE